MMEIPINDSKKTGNLQLHGTERHTLDSHHFKEEIKRNFKIPSDKHNENTTHEKLRMPLKQDTET